MGNVEVGNVEVVVEVEVVEVVVVVAHLGVITAAFDVRAGSAMRLSVTTATTANADRELLSNRVVVARHIPTNCRKVNV